VESNILGWDVATRNKNQAEDMQMWERERGEKSKQDRSVFVSKPILSMKKSYPTQDALFL